MVVLELGILVICYTVLIIALFLQILCYRKKIETKEAIAFTSSLLLFVISLSLSPIIELNFGIPLAVSLNLLCVIFLSVTTLLNVLSERKHNFPIVARNIHVLIGAALLILLVSSYIFGFLEYVEQVVLSYLILSVVISMLIVFRTKPEKRYEHLEKTERRLAFSFLILVPVIVVLNVWFVEQYDQLQIGFIIPLIFILMGVNKIYDDIGRLSIIGGKLEPNQQKFKNYNFTKREGEIATLLFEGHTYKAISERLFISLPTVKTHASNVYKKCDVKTRHELVSLLMS